MATMPRWKQALNHGRGQGNISAQKYHHMPMLGVRSWTCSAAMQGSCLWGLCLVQVYTQSQHRVPAAIVLEALLHQLAKEGAEKYPARLRC